MTSAHIENGNDTAGISAAWSGYVWVVKFENLAPGGTIDKVAIEISNAVGNVRYKIYSDDGEEGRAGTLLAESNSIAASAGKVYNSLISSATIPTSGNVWVGFECDSVLLSIFYALIGEQFSVIHTYGTGPTPYGRGAQTLLTEFWAGINVNSVTNTKTFTLNTLTKSPAKTKTFIIDSYLVRIKSFAIDTIAKGPGTGDKKYFTLDTRIVNRKTKTFTIDLFPVNRNSITTSIDSTIKAINGEDFRLDTITKKTFTLSRPIIDTLIVNRGTKTYSIDSLIKLVTPYTFLLDCFIMKRGIKTFALDVRTQRRKQFTIGCVISNSKGVSDVVYTRKGVSDIVYTEEQVKDIVYTRQGVKDNVYGR